MNYGSEPADQVVRYSLEGAEFALRISGTAAKNFFIFAQAVLHDSKKTHGKTQAPQPHPQKYSGNDTESRPKSGVDKNKRANPHRRA